MKKINFYVFFISFFFASLSHACQLIKQENIQIVGTDEQKNQVCHALEKAVQFFDKYGYIVDFDKTSAKITFNKKVLIPKTDSKGNNTYGGGIRVLALFDRGNEQLSITDEKEPWIKSKERTFFALPYNKELYESVIFHEIVHLISKQFYQYSNYGHAQEEYIAYAAQIESMSSALRERVINKCPKDECRFTDEVNINDLVHFQAPHKFGIMSFLHFSSPEGGKKMLKRIYSGEFKPFDFSMLP